MPRPNRSEMFDPSEVSINHCVARCVRQEFLLASKSRREWMIDRLKLLCGAFCIDALSMAFMSNHVHLILRNRPDIVKALSNEEVARCWLTVFPGTAKKEPTKAKKKRAKKQANKGSKKSKDAVKLEAAQSEGANAKQCNSNNSSLEPSEYAVKSLAKDTKKIKTIRSRLSDISWLMRAFCQYVAVRANREDKKKGRFWQGRFFSQPLIDEAALLACSVYIELNPVRAGLADSINSCDYTSILARINSLHLEKERMNQIVAKMPSPIDISSMADSFLAPIQLDPNCLSSNPQISQTGCRASDRGFLNLTREQYIELVDCSVRILLACMRNGEKISTPSILESLKVPLASWTLVLDPQSRIFQRQKSVALKQTFAVAS